MNREEQNRKLAEWLEPCPEEFTFGDCRLVSATDLRSPLGVWRPKWTHGREPFPWHWAPSFDFFTDEAANALLLDRLAGGYHLDGIRYGPEEMEIAVMLAPVKVDELALKHGYRKVLIADRDRKAAVCRAALTVIGD